MSDELTRPERFTEFAQARESRAKGCALCIHRAGSAWGRGYCKVVSLTFPRCMSGSGIKFERDFLAQEKAA
jgi:hypothetical protein